MKNNLKKLITVSITVVIVIILIIYPQKNNNNIKHLEYVNPDALELKSLYSKNANEICEEIKNKKIKIGVSSYYKEKDFILAVDDNDCTNIGKFESKTIGDDYNPWTYFDANNISKYKYYIDDVEIPWDDSNDSRSAHFLTIYNNSMAYDANNKLKKIQH